MHCPTMCPTNSTVCAFTNPVHLPAYVARIDGLVDQYGWYSELGSWPLKLTSSWRRVASTFKEGRWRVWVPANGIRSLA